MLARFAETRRNIKGLHRAAGQVPALSSGRCLAVPEEPG